MGPSNLTSSSFFYRLLPLAFVASEVERDTLTRHSSLKPGVDEYIGRRANPATGSEGRRPGVGFRHRGQPEACGMVSTLSDHSLGRSRRQKHYGGLDGDA